MIYIDVDGVLADFEKHVKEQTGYPYKGKDTWEVLEDIDNLFLQLEALPNAYDSVQNILDQQGYASTQILTALPLITGKLTTAQRDKVQWIHTWIDDTIQVNCVSNWSMKKHFVKNEWDILIDDRLECIQEWNAAGGVGILHCNWESTNKELSRIGVI